MGSPGAPTDSGQPFRDKREVPRYSFIAEVTVTDTSSDTRFSGRISEISRKGCYVDILNPLPVATSLQLKVTRDLGAFIATGKVIYTQPGMGMGVAFVTIADDQMKTLDAWLAELKS
ncbi:MAG: PilZ domain-containing protein [Candidatus Acidiferrales bacterium]